MLWVGKVLAEAGARKVLAEAGAGAARSRL
jgi:hypothetical protein